MGSKSPKFSEAIMPFVGIGVFLVLMVVGLVVAFYVLVWGALVGLVVYLGSLLRNRFFAKPAQTEQSRDRIGKTYDHEE